MDQEISVTVEQLKEAGSDVSKQVPALLELGEWYLKKAKKTSKGGDFTKANGLYNAALARSRSVNHEISEDQILLRIVETYREFLYAFAKDEANVGEDAIKNEINSHKEFLVSERSIFQQRVDEIDSCFYSNDKTEEQYQIHADQMHEVFRDIQDMYIRLVSMLAKECESRLGQPPCDFAIIALGSVARMEATPFSDLEFAILYADPAIGDKINYFRILTHFLHLKVINLGETILPALAIEQLNDYRSDYSDSWFFDSGTPRGISFDGAMPWASKTPLGRMATKSKPALELIKTPEQMAELQDEEIGEKKDYHSEMAKLQGEKNGEKDDHLADILTRVALIFGDQSLMNDYNERLFEKLNRISTGQTQFTTTVGFERGIDQMAKDLDNYDPYFAYIGRYCTVGALFDAKKQFYRLISLLLSDLELIFDLRCPSPWQVISELQIRGIISASDSVHIKVCLSIANEIRLKTYFANKGQKELLSPVTQYKNTTEQSADPPIFRYFDEDSLIRLLSISTCIHKHCKLFLMKYTEHQKIDKNQLGSLSPDEPSKTLIGAFYYRLQNLPKALEWMKSESEDSLDYPVSLVGQGVIHSEYGDYEKSVECFERALVLHYQYEGKSHMEELPCLQNLVSSLICLGRYKKAEDVWMQAIKKHDEIYSEKDATITLSRLIRLGGLIQRKLGDFDSAFETFKKVEKMLSKFRYVPDEDLINVYINIALTLSELDEHAQSLEHVERALHLSKKVFGRADLSFRLGLIHNDAAIVYEHCNQSDKALCWYQHCLGLLQTVFGDDPHPGKRTQRQRDIVKVHAFLDSLIHKVSCLNNLGNFFLENAKQTKLWRPSKML